MDILFADSKLEGLCTDEKKMTKQLGADGAKKLKSRLADLRAASKVSDLVAGRPHPLKKDRVGQFAVDLDGGRRLVFEPAADPIPETGDGAIDWTSVRVVRIVFVGDYHD